MPPPPTHTNIPKTQPSTHPTRGHAHKTPTLFRHSLQALSSGAIWGGGATVPTDGAYKKEEVMATRLGKVETYRAEEIVA